MDGIKLTFDEDALEYIVDKAIEYKLGARGLRSIVESIMIRPQFEMPTSGERSFNVTKEFVENELNKARISAA